MIEIAELPLHTIAIGGILVILSLLFISMFIIPAILQSGRLAKCIKGLAGIESKNNVDSIKNIFKTNLILSHLWDEFSHTLHEQKDLDANGIYHVTAIRQTVPAETYFNEQILVDSPLRADFFKHLPGILTGIGIIGTFYGLIIGLQAFQVDENPVVVRESLNNLLHGVYQAFIVSGSAIFLAMVITFIEKWILANLYKKVELLCIEIDKLYDAGAGEEYLSRLVHASESSAKEAKQLKQSLVNDLKQILESVIEKQIQAQQTSSSQIAKEIVEGINASLHQPLADIGSAVKHVSSNQGEAVNKLLTDTMAAMTAQIRDLFSGQVEGIRGMQQHTIDALDVAVEQLQQMVADISTKGKETTDAMNAQLVATLNSMDERQRMMSEQTQALLDSMKAQIKKSQDETSSGMNQAIEQMSHAVKQVVDVLQANVEKVSERDDKRSREIMDHANHITNSTSTLSKEMIKHTAEAISTMRQAVETMKTSTVDTVNKMNLGASDMLKAATEMSKVGASTNTTLEKAQSLVGQMNTASTSLTNTTSLFNKAIDDYKATRDTLAVMIEQLKSTVESARKEASLTADVLHRIESATKGLMDAQKQADEYMGGLTDVLSKAHNEFGTQIVSTLDRVNGEFHKHVEKGTKALGGAIDELDQVLDRVVVHKQ